MLKKISKVLITLMMILGVTTMISAEEPIPAPYVSVDPVFGTGLVSETLVGTSINLTGFVSWVNGFVFQTTPQVRSITGLRTLQLHVDGVLDSAQQFGGPDGLQPVSLLSRGTTGSEFSLPWTVPADAEVGDKFVLKVVALFATTQSNYSAEDSEEVEIVAEFTFYVVPMAAPNVAELILKFNGVDQRFGKGRTGGNFVQLVAHHMGVVRNLDTPLPTDFAGENKEFYNEDEDRFEGRAAYRLAVLNFLNSHHLLGSLVMPCDEYFNSYGEITCP